MTQPIRLLDSAGRATLPLAFRRAELRDRHIRGNAELRRRFGDADALLQLDEQAVAELEAAVATANF